MDEIVPGLWVGGVRAAMDAEYLSRAGITHIISCMKQKLPVPPPLEDGRVITRAEMRHVRIDDDEKAPILVHFASCNEFIAAQLEEEWVADDPQPQSPSSSGEQEAEGEEDEVTLLVQGRQKRAGQWGSWQTTGAGTVLVHCQAGCSRSVAICAAYLMSTRRISATTAVDMIRRRREDAEPNRGFMAQLSLYEQVGFEVDMKYQAVRRFLMSKTDILNGDSMDDMLLSYYPSPYPSPALSASGGGRALKGFTAINDEDGAAAAAGTSTIGSSAVDEGKNPKKPRSRSASFSSTSSNSASRISLLSSITPTPNSNGSDSEQIAQLEAQLSTMSSPHTSTSAPAVPGTSTIPADENAEVKVTANSSGRLPGGVAQIRGHEGKNNRGELARPTFTGPKLRCKGCRRELAALDHVVIHEPGKGQLAFEHRRRDAGHSGENVGRESAANGEEEGKDDEVKERGEESSTQSATTPTSTTQSPPAAPPSSSWAPNTAMAAAKKPIQTAASLNSQLPPHLAALRSGARPQRPTPTPVPSDASPCSTPTVSVGMSSMLKSAACSSYFIEPMAWMSSLSSGEVTGRLNCPTPKCAQKLGSWDWAGMQCGCGAWVTPAFSLHRSKVDEF